MTIICNAVTAWAPVLSPLALMTGTIRMMLNVLVATLMAVAVWTFYQPIVAAEDQQSGDAREISA